jgi:hypothetical protein
LAVVIVVLGAVTVIAIASALVIATVYVVVPVASSASTVILTALVPSATLKVLSVTAVSFAVYSLMVANESVKTGTKDTEAAELATDAV